ncbi:hypothetical protein Btru_027642 [Bulinus truncatus]|nr:hypothetical protein Btru_027642 [Bulinus truncatus]
MKRLFCFLSCVFLCAVQVSCTVIDPNRGAFPGLVPCTQGADCGNTACCLGGTCSTSGSTGKKCYINVKANGRPRPAGIWNETDVCPCISNDYCRPYPNSGHDARYGEVGVCSAVMR